MFIRHTGGYSIPHEEACSVTQGTRNRCYLQETRRKAGFLLGKFLKHIYSPYYFYPFPTLQDLIQYIPGFYIIPVRYG